MEQQRIFRDYYEQQAEDHNALQDSVRASIDRVVRDVCGAGIKFADLTVTGTPGQVEIAITPGAVYDGGKVYGRRTPFTQNLALLLAPASRRIVIVVAYGQDVETDLQERDKLVNVETGQTQPESINLTNSRDVAFGFYTTADSPTPDAATVAIPPGRVAIAHILVNTTGIVSVTPLSANTVTSTEALELRAKLLETFQSQILPRVASLASDLAGLQVQLQSRVDKAQFGRVFEDLARVKEALRFPDVVSDYGADWFLDQKESDMLNALALGFDAKVEEGIRFGNANATQFQISLFSANDPNARVTNGLLLPAFTEELKIFTGNYASDLGMAQYGFQTISMKQGFMSRSRLRYGGSLTQCSNGAQYSTPGEPWPNTNLYDFNTQEIDVVGSIDYAGSNANFFHEWNRQDTWWFDTWKEPYMYAVTTDLVINGAQIAQTFLVSNDMWMTKFGFYCTAKGGAEDISIVLCETTGGEPDPDKVILKTVYPHAQIVTGWNRIAIPPTFAAKGKRLAWMLVSNANHKLGMASGQSYLAGTFFTSTDGRFQLGDLTKDLMLEVWGAKFGSSQVTIEFNPINLDGGFRTIDILAEQWVPESSQLVFEVRPNGAGDWLPLTRDNAGALSASPVLAQFRGRFVGTPDVHAAIRLPGSRVKVSRPKTTFKHVSVRRTLKTTSSTIHVKLILERFDETPHDLSCRLRINAGNVIETADSVTTKLLDAGAKRYEREFIFNTATPVTSFVTEIDGSTTSSQNTFHVAELTYFSI